MHLISLNYVCHELFYCQAKIEALNGKLGKALSYVDKALELEPHNLECLFSKSRWLINTEEFYSAIPILNKILEIEKYFSETVYFYRALISYKIEDYKNIKKDLRYVRDDFTIFILGKLCSKQKILNAIGKTNPCSVLPILH